MDSQASLDSRKLGQPAQTPLNHRRRLGRAQRVASIERRGHTIQAVMHKEHFRLRVDLAYAIARRIIVRRQAGKRTDRSAAVTSWQAYGAWRYQGLREQYEQFFDGSAKDRDVLDFGCGDGALCFVVLDSGAKS